MNIKKQLLNKNALIINSLAKEFMTKEEGDRISTVAEYAEKYSLARGTVQLALKFLCELEAVAIDRRGHLGSYLTMIDYMKLLNVTDINFIVGVMPLPYTKRYEGLATGLYNSEFAKRFSLNLAYMRGAVNRLESLMQNRYDFAVMSKLAAKYYIANGHDIDIVLSFGRNSFVGNHAIVFFDPKTKTIADGMRIGIDSTSIDHELITRRLVAGKKVQLLDMPYNVIKAKLREGELDAAVMTLDEVKDKEINYNTKLVDLVVSDYENTEAVIVVKRDRLEIKKILEKYISKDTVLDIQDSVISNKLTPNY